MFEAFQDYFSLQFLAYPKMFSMKTFLGGKGHRQDLQTLTGGKKNFNSSESVFQVKKVGGFLSPQGGGQRRFDICHKKVVLLFEGSPYATVCKHSSLCLDGG